MGFVAVLMGSDSDLPVMQTALDTLTAFAVEFEVRITSAHRTPANTHAYVRSAEERGCSVFIAAAGMAAHLAGTVAGLTIKPVLGVPLEAGPLKGIDALLATVQMPGGIPVGCTAIGKAGAKNAALLALQILAVNDPELTQKLRDNRTEQANQVIEKNKSLQLSL